MCAMCEWVYVLLVVARIGLSVCLHTHTKLIHRFWLFVRSFSALYGYFYVFISGILLVLGHPVSICCTLYFSNDVWLYTLAIAWCCVCVCVCAFFFGCSWFWWTQFSLLLRLAWNLLLFLLWYLRLSLCVWTCCCLTVVIYIILNWNLGCCSFFVHCYCNCVFVFMFHFCWHNTLNADLL